MKRIETGRLALVPDMENARFDICALQDNRTVGWVRIEPETGEMTVRVYEDFRRMGYGTEAARAAAVYASKSSDPSPLPR